MEGSKKKVPIMKRLNKYDFPIIVCPCVTFEKIVHN